MVSCWLPGPWVERKSYVGFPEGTRTWALQGPLWGIDFAPVSDGSLTLGVGFLG